MRKQKNTMIRLAMIVLAFIALSACGGTKATVTDWQLQERESQWEEWRNQYVITLPSGVEQRVLANHCESSVDEKSFNESQLYVYCKLFRDAYADDHGRIHGHEIIVFSGFAQSIRIEE